MFGLFDKRPWVVVEHSNGLAGHNTRIKGTVRTRSEAKRSVTAMNQVSPYGRVYHVHYWWEARPATPAEIKAHEGYSE